MSSNNLGEITIENTSATSYPVTATEIDPEGQNLLIFLIYIIKLVQLNMTSRNQTRLLLFNITTSEAQAKLFKFFYEQSYNVQDANSEIKKEIVKKLLFEKN